jgi:hypothetical protein
MVLVKLRGKIKKIYEKYKKLPVFERNVVDFIRFIVEYGTLLSIVAYGVLGVNIDIWRFFGLGITYYFIMYEAKAVYSYWKSD